MDFMAQLKLKCPSIDGLLDGGIEDRVITQVYGEAGTGKTNLCLQAIRECASQDKKIVVIDSEGISLKRLEQICTEGYNYKKILDKIIFFRPLSFEQQEKMIKNAVKIKDISLIVVDTINLFYRLNLEEDREGTMRSFVRQMANLQIAAREKKLWVIITEQVYTDKNGEIKPFTNRDSEHMIKTILKLEKKEEKLSHRKATIIKHRSQPEGKKTDFKITQTGLK
ncbi:MAG: DNA repair and recombination protein RadB [Candidatus Thermoplasmatota archaeon]